MTFSIRLAVAADVPCLRSLIQASVRALQIKDYTPAQLEPALESVYGVDSKLIADGTYFVVEVKPDGADGAPTQRIVGCGGWSKRKTLFGGDVWIGREDTLLNPKYDAAKIRAFFVHPDWARRGIGTIILDACERAALAAGFAQLEMAATLTGVAFYQAKGYITIENLAAPLADGESLPIVRMGKQLQEN